MPSQLFFTNIPYNCSDREFREWIESRGVEVESIRIIRDLVAGVSPAFAYANVKDDTRLVEAVSVLNGKRIRDRVVTVKQMPERPADSREERFFTAQRPT
jgi:hypothetical protein